MMNRNYFLAIVIIALGCLFLIFFSVGREIETPVTKEPVIPPPLAPYTSYISAIGTVEASSENISIGTSVTRIVDKVLVAVGDKVKKGDVLFRLENRDLKANLMAQQAAYEAAVAKYQRLEAFPRAEDLAAASANFKGAEADLELAKNKYDRVLGLPDPRAISQEEKNHRLFNYQQAEAKWLQAKADLEKIQAGTWKPDLEIARHEVQQAKANVNLTKAELDRTIIQSPIEGSVLQVKVHEGESTSLDTTRMPMMILGNTDQMYLRVSINQLDIHYFSSSAPAVAFLRGDAHVQFPIEYVRLDPFLVNKQDFSNNITETVDTRVLQVIYRIKNEDPTHPLFVGQQMDVFIKANYSS